MRIVEIIVPIAVFIYGWGKKLHDWCLRQHRYRHLRLVGKQSSGMGRVQCRYKDCPNHPREKVRGIEDSGSV